MRRSVQSTAGTQVPVKNMGKMQELPENGLHLNAGDSTEKAFFHEALAASPLS
jgi:hypothetical protein